MQVYTPFYTTSKEKIFDTSQLTSGIYFLIIRSKNEIKKREKRHLNTFLYSNKKYCDVNIFHCVQSC
ncbi:MAG: hypothetical protein IPP27_13540 [Bacteroidetes bacterium]|nr:hypothetical protein [Bacteroidota bacterium]